MARKTNKFSIDNDLGQSITVEEKYYLGNPSLPTNESKYEWTKEMMRAALRCKEDIIYFAENFFTIIADGVRMHIPLRKYQKDFLQAMFENKRLVMCCSRQVGKCCHPDTIITFRYKPLNIKVKMKIKTFFKLMKYKFILTKIISFPICLVRRTKYKCNGRDKM